MKQDINPLKETVEAKPITESIKLYPAGRGKVLILTEKRVPPKPKNYKRHQARFGHLRIKSNPEDITITEYLQQDTYAPRKHIYFFPKAKQLSYKEREDLALTLLSTLPSIYLGTRGKGEPMKFTSKFPVFLSTRQRQILKQKWKRYIKWRKRHN